MPHNLFTSLMEDYIAKVIMLAALFIRLRSKYLNDWIIPVFTDIAVSHHLDDT